MFACALHPTARSLVALSPEIASVPAGLTLGSPAVAQKLIAAYWVDAREWCRRTGRAVGQGVVCDRLRTRSRGESSALRSWRGGTSLALGSRWTAGRC